MVWFTEAKKHDHMLLEKLKMDSNTIYVLDKGYNDYKAFKKFSTNNTRFVTRIKDNAVYESIQTNEISSRIHSGVFDDQIIEVKVKDESKERKLKLRKVRFYDRAFY